MTSNVAQRSPRWLNMVSNVPQEASTPTQNGPNWPRGLPNKPPRGNNPSKTLGGSSLLAVSPVPSRRPPRGLKMVPRRHLGALRGAREGPNTAPRAPENAPRAPQYGAQEAL